MTHDRCRRRLSVGAGNPQQSQLGGWISVCGASGDRRGAATLSHNQRGERCTRGVFDNGYAGSGPCRRIEEIMAIAAPPANRDEKIASLGFAAVVGDARNLVGNVSADIDEQPIAGEGTFNFFDAYSHSSGRLN